MPTITLTGLSDAQRRAYVIADNRLALNAGWDDAMLRVELQALGEDGFDTSLLGFGEDELSKILGDDDEHDDEPAADDGADSGQVGVIVVCDDANDQQRVLRLLRKQGLTCQLVDTMKVSVRDC